MRIFRYLLQQLVIYSREARILAIGLETEESHRKELGRVEGQDACHDLFGARNF